MKDVVEPAQLTVWVAPDSTQALPRKSIGTEEWKHRTVTHFGTITCG